MFSVKQNINQCAIS